MQNHTLVEMIKYLSVGRCKKYTLLVCYDGSGEAIYSVSAEFVGGDVSDRAFAEDICRDRRAAERFLYLIAYNEAEPCHLKDIVCDMLPL